MSEGNSKFIVPRSALAALAMTCVVAVGCKSKEQAATPVTEPSKVEQTAVQMSGPVAMATIERTSCFGKCPMYKATFYDNGEVKYVGKRFVDNIGTYTTLLSEDELNGIRQMVKDVGYFKLEDAYPTPVPDFPKCLTSVNIDGKQKSVLNGENAPRDLIGFERYLDGLIKGKELTKVSDSTSYQ